LKEVSISPHSFQKKLNKGKTKDVVERNFAGIYEKEDGNITHLQTEFSKSPLSKSNHHRSIMPPGFATQRYNAYKNRAIPEVKVPS